MTIVRAAAGGLVVAAGLIAMQPRPARAEDCITIANFSTDPIGRFPLSWKVRSEEGKSIHSVEEREGRRVLRAAADGQGIQAAFAHEWDLDAYPILAWSWRPLVFPRGADERSSSTNDSPLAVYLLVSYSRIRGPKAVKYIWSASVPVGTHLTSNGGLTQVQVLRSGAQGLERWTEERVDVLADYKRFFGESVTPTPAGISVLTDGDNTGSRAEGEYTNFRACRR
jgi:hypothetical protein